MYQRRLEHSRSTLSPTSVPNQLLCAEPNLRAYRHYSSCATTLQIEANSYTTLCGIICLCVCLLHHRHHHHPRYSGSRASRRGCSSVLVGSIISHHPICLYICFWFHPSAYVEYTILNKIHTQSASSPVYIPITTNHVST